MTLLLQLSKICIENKLTNIGIIECIVLILCIAIKNKHKEVLEVLYRLLESEYVYYTVMYLQRLLMNPWIINIKARLYELESNSFKYSYKVLGGCTSMMVQEKLGILPEIEYLIDNNIEYLLSQDRDELTAAGITLLLVFLSIILANKEFTV